MTTDRHGNDITTKQVMLHVPGMDVVDVRRNLMYKSAATANLEMDVYYPSSVKTGTITPAVLFVIGYSDQGAEAMFGRRFKEMEPFTSWAKLLAASGLIAVTYSTGVRPAVNIQEAIAHITFHAADLGIDANRLSLWASSGHVPTALSAVMEDRGTSLKCAVLFYGYTLDPEGATYVAEAAKMFRFCNASEGKSVDDLPDNIPLFIARAGQDQCPHLNDALDNFVARALARSLPLTVVNHPTGPHAFDIADDSDTTRLIVRQAIGFLKGVLLKE